MRLASLLLALALGACALGVVDPPTEEGCVRTARGEIAWSDPSTPDLLSARSVGADCVHAGVVLTITNRAGETLLTGEAGYAGMNFGDRTHDLPPVSEAEMDAFLASWLGSVWVLRSSALPEWPAGASGLPFPAAGGGYETYLDRETYMNVRGRDLPVLCYDVASETAECFAYDPTTHGTIAIAVFGI